MVCSFVVLGAFVVFLRIEFFTERVQVVDLLVEPTYNVAVSVPQRIGMTVRNRFDASALLVIFLAFSSCEYVRPTLNAPLKQSDPAGGYRLINLAPPEADNSDSLFLVATFSGGALRASTLTSAAFPPLSRQKLSWQGRKKRLLDELDV